MNYWDHVAQSRDMFTKSDKIIYDFIEQDPQLIEDMTISRLGKMAKVSTSAVLRYCQRLGYSGYSEFRFDLIKSIHSSSPISGASLVQSHLGLYKYGLEQLDSLPQEKLMTFVRLIVDAPFIACLGTVKSALPAMNFYYNFTSLKKRVLPLTGMLSPWAEYTVSPEDLILIFSVTGNTANEGIHDLLVSAREHNCNVLLVTCNKKPKLTRYATHILELPQLKTSDGLAIDPRPLMMILGNLLAEYARPYL